MLFPNLMSYGASLCKNQLKMHFFLQETLEQIRFKDNIQPDTN